MGKSKCTRSIFILLLDLTYTFYNICGNYRDNKRKTSYRDNGENIVINDVIVILHRPTFDYNKKCLYIKSSIWNMLNNIATITKYWLLVYYVLVITQLRGC